MISLVVFLVLGLAAAAVFAVSARRRAANGVPSGNRVTPATVERPRVLLAEDAAVARHLPAGLLKARGWEVHVAENGAEALAALISKRFDLAILDVQMGSSTASK